MRFAVALEGVLCKYPWIFQGIIRAFKRKDCEVIILTSHVSADSLKKDREYLEKSGLYSYKIIGKPAGGFSSARFKAQKCREENIDVLFESDPKIVEVVRKTTDTIVAHVV